MTANPLDRPFTTPLTPFETRLATVIPLVAVGITLSMIIIVLIQHRYSSPATSRLENHKASFASQRTQYPGERPNRGAVELEGNTLVPYAELEVRGSWPVPRDGGERRVRMYDLDGRFTEERRV
ncbi:Nn.00g027250.m01.CDS01 [Neocucurbitaria sp. VM-36]